MKPKPKFGKLSPRSDFSDSGRKFGRWTVIGSAEPRIYGNGRQRRRVLCRCSCADKTERAIVWWDLVYGKSVSCGCLRDEQAARRAFKHGCSHSPLTNSYQHMMRRCYNPGCNVWQWYGGRQPNPVKVCPRWNGKVSVFIADMKASWRPGMTLDRIDGNGDYSPQNCRWISRKQQQRNRLNNRQVKVDGRRMILVEAAEFVGVSRHRLRYDLNHNGGTVVVAGVRVSDI